MSCPLVNHKILQNIKVIKKYYQENIPQTSGFFNVYTSPFKVLKLKNVFTTDYQEELHEALKTLGFNLKDNDLYSLWQTEDLYNSSSEAVKKFINILKMEIGPFMSNVCNVEFNEKLSITASLYKKGDMLLCHDDKCEDRCIAFVYYLTESDKGGGTFDMFDHDENGQPKNIVCSMPPEKNTFVFFEVGNLTYHQVSEVIHNDFFRLSINGWFHSDRKLNMLSYEEPLPPIESQIQLEGLIFLDTYLNMLYCTPSILSQIQGQFEDESFILLKKIFTNKLFKSIYKGITSSDVNWRKKGPANRRSYEVAETKSLPSSVRSLLEFLKSSLFMSYLSNITGLSLKPTGDNSPGSKLSSELIRWSSNCYTMATDNDCFFKKPGLDLYLFFGSKEALKGENSNGYVVYLATDDDLSEKELITIVPEDNALVLVYRTEETVRFTKYIDHSVSKAYYAIYATYYEEDNNVDTS